MLERRSFTPSFPLREGWYNLHIREERCIVGRILFGQLLLCDEGARSLQIQEWQAFREPITVAGKRGLVWIAEDVDLVSRLNAAAMEMAAPTSAGDTDSHFDHEASSSGAAATARGTERPLGGGAPASTLKWGRRLVPRSLRRDRGVARPTLPAAPPLCMRRGPMNEDGVRASLRPRPRFLRRFLRRVAKAPASQAPSDGARAEPIARSVAQASSMVSRRRAGRTLKQFCKLMDRTCFRGLAH